MNTTNLQDKIFECADALGAISEMYPGLSQRFATARFAYDQAKALAWREILAESTKDGSKKPTEGTLESEVTIAVAAEQKEVRDATADLESIKFHFDLVKASLSAYQSAAKFAETESRMAQAGGYGA